MFVARVSWIVVSTGGVAVATAVTDVREMGE